MSDIHLRVPAQAEFVGLVRSTTNSVIARTDLGVDEIDDWALAIDEAFAIVLNHKPVSGHVQLDFTLKSGGVEITIAGPAGSSAEQLKTDACQWAWAVVSGLVEQATSEIGADGAITLTLKSRVVASA